MTIVQTGNLSDELCQFIQQLASDRDISISNAVIQLLTPTDQSDSLSHQHAQLHKRIKDSTEHTPESLKDAILDMVEQDSPDYRSDMAKAVTEAIALADNTPSLNADEFSEWFAQL